MKRYLSLFAVLLIVGCAGCLMVPMTKVSGTIAGQPFSLACPKNATLNGLEITAETNRVSVKIQSLVTVMDPQVITTTADGQTKLIQGAISSTADALGKVVSAVPK